jgi:hypothetical protein
MTDGQHPRVMLRAAIWNEITIGSYVLNTNATNAMYMYMVQTLLFPTVRASSSPEEALDPAGYPPLRDCREPLPGRDRAERSNWVAGQISELHTTHFPSVS